MWKDPRRVPPARWGGSQKGYTGALGRIAEGLHRRAVEGSQKGYTGGWEVHKRSTLPAVWGSQKVNSGAVRRVAEGVTLEGWIYWRSGEANTFEIADCV